MKDCLLCFNPSWKEEDPDAILDLFKLCQEHEVEMMLLSKKQIEGGTA